VELGSRRNSGLASRASLAKALRTSLPALITDLPGEREGKATTPRSAAEADPSEPFAALPNVKVSEEPPKLR
jgi:hypothetical protein